MSTFDLADAARRAMIARGFEVTWSPAAEAQAAAARAPHDAPAGVEDLRHLAWSSIDNRESQDLDQIEWAERLAGGGFRLLVGVADVDACVPLGSPIDARAAANTTTVYTGPVIFSMIPERLSCDVTSLLAGRDRLAVVVELLVDDDGDVRDVNVRRALVRNHVKLAYETVGAWLERSGARPPELDAAPEIEAQLVLQADIALRLKAKRHERGALELETIEARPVFADGHVRSLEVVRKSRARELVEDFMLATNAAVGGLLERLQVSSIRRVVRAPERWARIAAVARACGDELPDEPSGPALAAFLRRRRAAAPARFPDLSLSIVKLLGPGTYVVDRAGETTPGHFGLAAPDYTHSTAPNRRFADVVTQRLLKALAAGAPAPYSDDELLAAATRCTQREDDARKVERAIRKLAAAVLLRDRIGDTFEGVITGASPKGTFVRLVSPAAEGRIVRGERGLDVGDRVNVRLLAVDLDKAFVDFAGVGVIAAAA